MPVGLLLVALRSLEGEAVSVTAAVCLLGVLLLVAAVETDERVTFPPVAVSMASVPLTLTDDPVPPPRLRRVALSSSDGNTAAATVLLLLPVVCREGVKEGEDVDATSCEGTTGRHALPVETVLDNPGTVFLPLAIVVERKRSGLGPAGCLAATGATTTASNTASRSNRRRWWGKSSVMVQERGEQRLCNISKAMDHAIMEEERWASRSVAALICDST
jgi:hypothetical protein